MKQKYLIIIITAILVAAFYIAFESGKPSVNYVEVDDNPTENLNADSDHSASTVDTSDWVSYKNTKYGYVLKYPNDWKGGETSNTTDYATFYKGSRDAGSSGPFL